MDCVSTSRAGCNHARPLVGDAVWARFPRPYRCSERWSIETKVKIPVGQLTSFRLGSTLCICT